MLPPSIGPYFRLKHGRAGKVAEGSAVIEPEMHRRREVPEKKGYAGHLSGGLVTEKKDHIRIALDTCRQAWQNDGCVQFGAWRSLVARLPWAQEVRGSNPRAPTNIPKGLEPKAVSRKVPVRTTVTSSIER